MSYGSCELCKIAWTLLWYGPQQFWWSSPASIADVVSDKKQILSYKNSSEASKPTNWVPTYLRVRLSVSNLHPHLKFECYVLQFVITPHYECYVLLRMLRSTSGAVRHHYECYEDLRMLRSFFPFTNVMCYDPQVLISWGVTSRVGNFACVNKRK